MRSVAELAQAITSRFQTAVRDVHAGPACFQLIMVRDANCLVDAVDLEAFARDERLPYWAELWPSSIELARHCLEDLDLRGARVLELGCGLGLAGIAAAAAGAEVTMADYDTDALLFARYNVMTNLPADTLQRRVRLLELDWRTPPPLPAFDLILGADIVYERKTFAPLLAFLSSHLEPSGTAILTDPSREIGRAFLEAAREHFITGTVCSEVAWDDRRITIARMTLRPRREPS